MLYFAFLKGFGWELTKGFPQISRDERYQTKHNQLFVRVHDKQRQQRILGVAGEVEKFCREVNLFIVGLDERNSFLLAMLVAGR